MPTRSLTDWVIFATIVFGASFSASSAYFNAKERQRRAPEAPALPRLR